MFEECGVDVVRGRALLSSHVNGGHKGGIVAKWEVARMRRVRTRLRERGQSVSECSDGWSGSVSTD